MAKINDRERNRYSELIVPYNKAADEQLQEEHNILSTLKKNVLDAPLNRLKLAELMLDLSSNYLVSNSISVSVLGVKNEEALNNARKAVYKSIIYYEAILSNYVDAPFSDYESRLEQIESVNPEQRYLLARKTGFTINLLENAYGDNTKWKWTFVDLEGRFAAVAKNMINLRSIITDSDPRSPYYMPVVFHLKLVKKLLSLAADRYREKYELSTNRIDDFKMGITFLSALKRLDTLTGDEQDAGIVKKRLDIWTNKLTSDMTKSEKQ
ncbi:MAG: hypothetical protein FWH38_06875 [Treponema sp.]|nr:hypothetical protein [Treponema sp.]